MIRTIFFVAIIQFLIYLNLSYAQGIKGVIKNSANNPVSYVSIFVEQLNIGTTSNLEGEYSIKLPSGTYKVIYRALGFLPQNKEISVKNRMEKMDIILADQVYQLAEVTVKKNEEDPAYPILRKVISLAPFHLNQVKHYRSEVYMRGTVNIIKIPRLLQGRAKVNNIDVKSGDVFTQESVNEIEFNAPDKYIQRTKSLRSTFPFESSEGVMQDLKFSFYQPMIDAAISPLSPKAFSYYRFVYEGFSFEGNNTIYKIRVIPKSKGPETFGGQIFIVDGFWTIHSLDLTSEISFGSFTVRQIYSPVREDAWLPVSHNLYVGGSLMGMKGDFNFVSSVKYSDIQMNTTLKRPTLIKTFKADTIIAVVVKKQSAKEIKQQQTLETLSKKDKLTNRDMIKIARIMREESKKDTARTEKTLEIKEKTIQIIDPDASKKDSAYWNSIRPVPLTPAELKADIQRKDTLQKNGKDSTTVKKPKKIGKFMSFIFGGKNFKLADSSVNLTYKGLIGFKKFDFNTVEGFIARQQFGASWDIDSVHKFVCNPEVGYAFNRESFMWKVNGNYTYSPLKRGKLEYAFGHHTSDFNQDNGIHPFVNLVSSLFFRRNYEKLFDNTYFKIGNRIDLANGLECKISTEYQKGSLLNNSTDYSFFYTNDRKYTLNYPVNKNFMDTISNDWTSFSAEIQFKYTPQQYYRIRKGVKYYEKSDFPTFHLLYRKGFKNVFNCTADFDIIEAGVNYKYDWTGFKSITANVKTGSFLNKTRLPFTDFKHFNTQNLPVSLGNFTSVFSLLDYYKYSSSDYFVEGHFQYSTSRLLIKYIPLISNRLWTENLYVHFLHNENITNYTETGYSLNNVGLIGSLGIFAGFTDGKFNNAGFRVAIILN
jgi:hypothetical protein